MKKRVGADNRGFTLLEVILSIAILGLITVPIMKYFTDSMRYTSLMEQKQKATLEAQDTIEYLKAQDRVLVRKTNPSTGALYYWTPDEVGGSDETDLTTGTFKAYDFDDTLYNKTEGKGTLKLTKSDSNFDTLVTLSTDVSANSVSRPIIYGIDDTKNVMIVEREEETEAILYFMALNTSYVANQSGLRPFASPSASPSTDPLATPAPSTEPVVILDRNNVRRYLQREINVEIDKDAENCYTVKAYYKYSCSHITDNEYEYFQTSNLIDTRIEKLEGLYLLFNMTDDTKDKINVKWNCLAPGATEKAMELVLICQNLDQLAGGGATPAPGATASPSPSPTPTPTATPVSSAAPSPTSLPFTFSSDVYKPTLVLTGNFSGWASNLTVRSNLYNEDSTLNKGEIREDTHKAEFKPLTSTGTPVRIVSLDVEVYKAGELATGGTPLVKMQTTKGE